MDEVVAFARQLRGLQYDAFHAFVQSLTEAATMVDRAVVIGSLPESGTEVGNEQGHDALQRLEKIFGRVQSAWTPASGIETFEIVRRRLFQPLDEEGEKTRDDTVRAFHKLYRDSRADSPAAVSEAAYREEMRRAWPLHPEVLRRFSGDWSVLEKFQRTRGILKIMANAVYALWSGESHAPMIMPALLPFRDDKVRTALLEPLDRAFGPILQSEVDGNQSLTAHIEAQRPRLSKSRAATLAARAVFFATAPHRGAARGGMTGTELRLACAQPGDQIAMFGEALQEIAARSAHLYRDGDSYWYSPQPTLNKLAEDRAHDVSEESVDDRIAEFLRVEARTRAGFARVHAAPDNPTDIDDRRAVALVILPPSASHDTGAGSNSKASLLAAEIMTRRGTGQRRYRNTLVFTAAEASSIRAVRDNARRERAWRSILSDTDLMQNLTQAQSRDAAEQAKRSGEALSRSVRGAWVHILVPARPGHEDADETASAGHIMHFSRLINRGAANAVPHAVWDKAVSDGNVVDRLGPQNLLRNLDQVWAPERPHIAIKEVREWFASYVYLPRVRDDAVLEESLQGLIRDIAEPYAYAAGFDEDSGTYYGVVDGKALLLGGLGDGLLVRRNVIRSPETASGCSDGSSDTTGTDKATEQDPADNEDESEDPAEPSPRRFFASLSIDSERAGLEVARIMDGLLVELTRTPGSTLHLTPEIDGRAGNGGYPKDVVETVKANARDLKLDGNPLGFEED